jgi:hypothetical protein
MSPRMAHALAAAALLLVPSAASAQDAPTAQSSAAQSSAAQSPTAQSTAIEPARLAAGQRVVARIFPPGIYKRLMGSSFDQVLETLTGSMGEMPLSEIARYSGITAEEATALGEGKMKEAMAIYDPHWQERFRRTTRAMTDAMSGMMTEMEPALRDAMARAYAREFTNAELADLDRFFATPSGARYADKSMALMMDPEVIKATTAAVPKMMEHMPAIMAAAEKADTGLPKPRTNSQLTPAERTKLAALLGVEASALEKDPPVGEEEAGS